jgi:flagellar hook-associated protein 2
MATSTIQGIISNLDTNSIVEAIMTYEHRNVDLLTNRKTEKTNELTTWQSINALFLALKTQTSLLAKDSTWNTAKIDVSDADVLTASATGTVQTGTYFFSVDALAQNHQIASQGYADTDTTEIGTGGTLVIGLGDSISRTITIDSTNNTLSTLKDAINNLDMGITATIVNDGSSSNSYRLVLSSNDTGTDHEITLTNSITGETIIDFENSSFDDPETTSWSSTATSTVSLGDTASYTGSTNKTYTFTVGGTGVQTVSSGDITINWTDGTNSGSVVVTQANQEVALTGTGSDGLKLSFDAGDLVAGDTFQVGIFSPLLQAAQDASISIGSTTGGGSPVTIKSHSNTVTDLIPGVRLDLKSVSASPITVQTSPDIDSMKNKINQFISSYNNVVSSVNQQFSYNSDTEETGTLMGDMYLMNIHSNLRSVIGSAVSGVSADYNMLTSMGIRTDANGKLYISSTSDLDDALNNHLEDVIKLFKTNGNSSNDKIVFLSASSSTKANTTGYAVNITQAATQGNYQGVTINDPAVTNLTIDSTNDELVVSVDGTTSGTISLTNKTYTSGTDLAAEIQSQINADETLSNRNVSVTWTDSGDTGYLTMTSNTYGSNSKVSIGTAPSHSGHTVLGFIGGTETAGLDVAGTINGEVATGVGQILTGNNGNTNTAGVRIQVTLTENELDSDENEGTITITKGLATLADELLARYTDSNTGTIAYQANSLQKQIDDIQNQIDDQEERLAKRQEDLYTQYTALEQALANFQSQSSFLESQLNYLNNYWKKS